MSNNIKVPCGGFKIASDQFYFDENGALNPALTGGGIRDEFVVEIADGYEEEVEVEGTIYKKIGDFPKGRDGLLKSLSYFTHFQDPYVSFLMGTYQFKKDLTNQYFVYDRLCCSGSYIYYRKNSNEDWNKGKQIIFAKVNLGIEVQGLQAIQTNCSFMPFVESYNLVTTGMLAWLYYVNKKPFCMFLTGSGSSFLEGILFGYTQDRINLIFNYYDFNTSSKYSTYARIDDIFNKTKLKDEMTLTTSQLNLRSPNGTAYQITVSNDGTLTTVPTPSA